MSFLSNKLYQKRLFAIIAGGLMPLAFAPYNFYLISVVSLIIIFYLWHSSKSARESFILGYLFAFTMFGIGVHWLHISINLFGGVNIIGALFFTFLLIAFISLYPALCGYLAFRFYKHIYIIALPALWVITEWCRGWILTGFPWLNIGTSQTDSIFANFAPVVGDYGISFIVCLIASAITIAITGNLKQRITSGAILMLIIISSLILSDAKWTEENGQELRLALIQGAIPQEIKWNPDQRQNTYDIYSSLSAPYWDSDLIIWPETAIPSLYHRADDFINGIEQQKHNSKTLFMSGLAYKDQSSNEYFNSILLIDDTHHFYHKHHLVPFGEYLPFKTVLGKLLDFLKIPMSDFSSGDENQKLLKTEKGIFGMSICYEDAYGTQIRQSMPDANILINVSNDAWFGDSLAPHQHLQIARMRAMENGRYLLRSTNTGISAVINNKGEVTDRSPQFIPHALYTTAKLFTGETPYSRYGNILIICIAILLLVLSYIMRPVTIK
jgi:apolipoprotein N-acyltransferase